MNAPTTPTSGSLLAPALALLALPAFLLVDTLLALLRGWDARTDPQRYGFAVAAVLGVPVLLLLLLPPTRRWMRARSAQLLLLGVVGLLAVVGIEVAAHAMLGPPDYWFHRRTPHTRRVFTPPAGLLAGVTGPSTYSTNAAGMRGPELAARDAATRILCVGGSTTECLYLDDTEAWPRLLMDGLQARLPLGPVWAGDVGKSGYSTADHVQLLESSTLLGLVDCVVLYVGANDLAHALMGRPLRATAELGPLWMRSHVMQAIRRVAETRAGLGRGERQAEDGSSYVLWRRRRALLPVVDTPPDLKEALGDYASNLRRIVQACRERGVRLVLIPQAVLWKGDLDPEQGAWLWMGLTPKGALAPGALRAAIERFNAVLREVASDTGTEVVDATVLSGKPELFYDDMHLSEAGAHALADLLVRHLGAPR